MMEGNLSGEGTITIEKDITSPEIRIEYTFQKDDIIIKKTFGETEPKFVEPSSTVTPIDSCFTYITNYSVYSKAGVSITGYNASCGTNITIPEKIENIDVINIEVRAFANKGLTGVILPNTLLEINHFAFNSNELTNVVIPSSVRVVKGNAFSTNKITSLTYQPTTIMFAMSFNDNLLPEDTAFIYASNGTTINRSEIKSYGGANKNVVIPDTVTTIGAYSFYGCGIETVHIPNTIGFNGIGVLAFYNNKITNITGKLTGYNIANGSTFNKNKLPDNLKYLYTGGIGEGATNKSEFWGYGGDEANITLPSGIRYIQSLSFRGVTADLVTIPTSVTNVMDNAFFDSSITKIRVPRTTSLSMNGLPSTTIIERY